MSFVDEIYRDNRKKEYPRPAPGAYDIRQTEKQYKEELERFKTRKIHISEKMHSLTNDEFLGLNVPGPGSFNPKVISDQFHCTSGRNLKHSDWIAKHKAESVSVSKKHKTPDFGSYKPHPQDYDTFAYTQQLQDLAKKAGGKQRSFLAQEERFKDPKKSKGQVFTTPAPSAYNLQQYWPVKIDNKNKDKVTGKKNFMDRITKGVTRSIYYH